MDGIRVLVEEFTARLKSNLPASIAELIGSYFEAGGGLSVTGVTAPRWLPVVEKGRAPRRSNDDHNLYLKIYRWMEARSMFRSRTAAGKINEAKALTWYINKYGTKQFRDGVFRDVYSTELENLKREVRRVAGQEVKKITSQFLK